DRCSGNSQFDINNLPVGSIGRLRGFALAVGLGPKTEEAGFGAQYQRVARIRKRLAIAFQALVERVEVGIVAVGLGIDGRGLGVAVTPNGLSLGIGFSQQLFALAFGLGSYAFGVGKPPCTQPVGFLLAFGLHATIDR